VGCFSPARRECAPDARRLPPAASPGHFETQVWPVRLNHLPVIVALIAVSGAGRTGRRGSPGRGGDAGRRHRAGWRRALGLAIRVAPGWRPCRTREPHGSTRLRSDHPGRCLADGRIHDGLVLGRPPPGSPSSSEGAVVEGANEWQLYTRIILPMMAPITLSATIVSVTSA